MAEAKDATAEGGTSPPYIPWKTFLNLVAKMEEGVPNRLDRSWLSKQSGAMHQPIMATFRFFELTDENNRPRTALDELAKDPDHRPERVRPLIEKHYAWALALGGSATHDELREQFKEHGVTGSTQNKAIRFFLSAASFASVPVSQHFQMPREAGGAGTSSRPVSGTSTRRRRSRRKPGDVTGGDLGNGPKTNDARRQEADPEQARRDQYFELLKGLVEKSDGTDVDKLLDRIESLIKPGQSTRRSPQSKGGDVQSPGPDPAASTSTSLE